MFQIIKPFCRGNVQGRFVGVKMMERCLLSKTSFAESGRLGRSIKMHASTLALRVPSKIGDSTRNQDSYGQKKSTTCILSSLQEQVKQKIQQLS